MESIFGRDNPFITEQPENAFYYPTTPKDINFDDKITCFSPSIENKGLKSQDGNAFESEKFLATSYTLRKDELPTKDNGSVYKDTSGSSKFEETWPSTEQITTSSEMDSSLLQQFGNKNLQEKTQQVENPVQGTIAGYINRFRNQPPRSRLERDKDASIDNKTSEFWWVKPPSSSTPKESDSSFSPPQRLRNSKMSFNKPPVSPEQRIKQMRKPRNVLTTIKNEKSSSTDLNDIGESDSETARIQRRAEKLLEISEGTLTSSSTEPKNQMFHQKSPSSKQGELPSLPLNHLSTRIARPESSALRQAKLTSEDDILYQWRLARKMEKAKQGGSIFSKLPHMTMNPISNSDKTGFQVETKDATSRTRVTSENAVAERETPTDKVEKTKATKISEMSSQEQAKPVNLSSVDKGTRESFCQTLAEYKSGKTGKPLSVEYVDIPSHMHTVCDILPCPHFNARHSEEAQRTKPTIDINNTLISCCKQTDLLHDINIDNPLKLNQPVLGHVDESSSYDTEEDLSNQKYLSSCKTFPVHKYGSQSSSNEPEQDDLKLKGPTEDRASSRKKEINKTSRQRPQNAKNLSTQKEFRESKRNLEVKEQLSSSDERISVGKEDGANMKNLITEVISDHLFPSSITREDSLISEPQLSIVEKANSQEEDCVITRLENDILKDYESDGDFPDDEILKILRQRRTNYIKTLREIETVLESYPGKEVSQQDSIATI